MRLSVVIPCYRSRETIAPLVEGLVSELSTVVESFEIILVVDGSPDDTYAQARTLEKSHPETVRALLLRRNYGQHNAIMAGLDRARYDITVTMDDDLQHRPDQVRALVEPLQDPTVDLVYGVPVVEEHGWVRSLSSRMVKGALALSDVPHARDVSAFRAFRTELREGFAHAADPFASIDVWLSWTTTSIRRVAVRMDPRPGGTSNYSVRSLVRHAMNMATGYGVIPLRLVTWLGLSTSLLGFVLLVVVLWRFVTGDITVAGFTTLAAMLAILSGALMLSIGILGEYIGRLHFRSMHKPTFLVRVDGRDDGPRAGIPGVELPLVRSPSNPDSIADAIRGQGPRATNSTSRSDEQSPDRDKPSQA